MPIGASVRVYTYIAINRFLLAYVQSYELINIPISILPCVGLKGVAVLIRKKYVRSVSATERYNLVFNESNSYNVNFVIEGHGKLDVDQIQAAANKAAESNPGCRIRLRSMLGFSKWIDSGIPPKVSEVDANHWDGVSSSGVEFFKNKFDVLNGGPVFDMLVSNGDTARLIFRGCHSAFDGRGIYHFGSEVLRALRGEPLLGAPSTITDEKVRQSYREKVPKSLPSMPEVIPVLPYQVDPKQPVTYVWRRLQLPRKINHCLSKLAVFLASYARQFSSGNVAFTVPVDFRGLRTQELSTGNLTGFVNVVVDESDTPRKVMRRITEFIRGYHDCYISSNSRKIHWTPLKTLCEDLRAKSSQQLHSTNNIMMSGGIVSFGYVDTSQLSYKQFKATTLIGIPGAVGRLNVFLANFDSSTELVFCAPSTFNHRGQLDEMVHACGEAL